MSYKTELDHLKEAYKTLCIFLGEHFWEVNKIRETWNGDEIGYNLRASSTLRKPAILDKIEKFIEDHQLPLRMTNKYTYTTAFEIYYKP